MGKNFSSDKKGALVQGMSLTNQIILLNVLLFFVSYIIIATYSEQFFVDNFPITPSSILAGEKLWTLLTSMFFHGGFFHIFANMFSLFFIGNFLERIIGRIRFFWLYILSGLIGGIFFVLAGLIFANDVSGVGASGAIFGLLGVLAVLVPYSRIYLILGPLILILADFILRYSLPAGAVNYISLIINVLIIIMIFSMLSFNPNVRKFSLPVEMPMWLLPIVAIVPLVLIDFIPGINLPIGNSAHIGGLVVGLLYGFYLRHKFPKKTNLLRKHFR